MGISTSCQKDILNEQNIHPTFTENKSSFFEPNFASTQNPNIKNGTAAKVGDDYSNALVKDIIADLQQREEKTPFAECLATLAGYPVWDRTYAMRDDAKFWDVAWIPFVKLEGKQMESHLFCIKFKDKFYYHFLHSGYNQHVFRLADSLKLSDDERVYRKHSQDVIDYFNNDLFSLQNSNAPDHIDLPQIVQGLPIRVEPTDDYPEGDDTVEEVGDNDIGEADDGGGTGDQDCPVFGGKPRKPHWGNNNSNNGGGNDYVVWSSAGNFYNYSGLTGGNNETGSGGGGGSSSGGSTTLETIFGQYIGPGNLAYEAFFNGRMQFHSNVPKLPKHLYIRRYYGFGY